MYVCISKTVEDKDSYCVGVSVFHGTEIDFGDGSFCNDLNSDVDHVPVILQATTLPSSDMAGLEQTDFLVFLDLIIKLTDDINAFNRKSTS